MPSRITASPARPGNRAATSSPIASVSTPTATSATTFPSYWTGTTARTERPSVPCVVSTTVVPRAAGSNVPTKRLPIRPGVGCE